MTDGSHGEGGEQIGQHGTEQESSEDEWVHDVGVQKVVVFGVDGMESVCSGDEGTVQRQGHQGG